MLSKSKKKPTPVNQDFEEEEEYTLNEFEKLLERRREFVEEKTSDEDLELEEPPKGSLKKGKAVSHTHIKPKKEKKYEPVEEEENVDGFDVKSAIIYSSILERKKFRR